jgi:hypothetical protein
MSMSDCTATVNGAVWTRRNRCCECASTSGSTSAADTYGKARRMPVSRPDSRRASTSSACTHARRGGGAGVCSRCVCVGRADAGSGQAHLLVGWCVWVRARTRARRCVCAQPLQPLPCLAAGRCGCGARPSPWPAWASAAAWPCAGRHARPGRRARHAHCARHARCARGTSVSCPLRTAPPAGRRHRSTAHTCCWQAGDRQEPWGGKGELVTRNARCTSRTRPASCCCFSCCMIMSCRATQWPAYGRACWEQGCEGVCARGRGRWRLRPACGVRGQQGSEPLVVLRAGAYAPA